MDELDITDIEVYNTCHFFVLCVDCLLLVLVESQDLVWDTCLLYVLLDTVVNGDSVLTANFYVYCLKEYASVIVDFVIHFYFISFFH